MPLTPGTRFGPYEITGLIGAGGMGEVYRARDTTLDRDVAVKVLADAFTSVPDRLARFEREARTLASLNHPHIAHVYGLEERGPARALVMELVEGEDLAQRVTRGPLPVPAVVAIARQLVDAVAAAHELGIVHRDLKPANIKVTPDGTVKVLDFGLAKTLDSVSAADAANSPTLTAGGTLQGVILGTAAYMSPEQARGHPVDARTDVWAFGCVLYEMLAGRPAFIGPTASDTIAKILEREPDWSVLPSTTPPGFRRLLARCLEKDPKRRLHAIADAQFEIDDAIADASRGAPSARPSSRVGRWAVAAVVVTAIAATVGWKLWSTRTIKLPPPRVMALTSYPGIEAWPSFSPDGQQVAFSWNGEKGDNEDIYVVIVSSDQPLRLTRHVARDVSPAWKPDGTNIAFVRLEEGRAGVYVVSPLGGAERKLAEFSAFPRDANGGPIETSDPVLSWSPDGRWLVVTRVTLGGDDGVFLVSGTNGAIRRLLAPSKARDSYRMAMFSPNGDALALVNDGVIEVGPLTATDPPSMRDPPRALTQSLGYVSGVAWTADGTELVFGRSRYPSPDPPSLWRLPVSGKRGPERIDLAGLAGYPVLSAAGRRLAFVRRGLNTDLLRLQEGRAPETLVASSFNEQDGALSPDGSKVAFASDRTGEGHEIWVAATADSSNRHSVTQGAHKPEGSPRWSPDGRRLVFDGVGDDGLRHVYLVDEAGGPIQAIPFKPGAFDQIPSWSRDGRWIYFGSNRTGREEIWRVPVVGGEAQQMTTTGGRAPFESWDGRTLFYLRSSGSALSIFAKPVTGGPERALGVNVAFWNYVPGERGLYYVAPRAGRRPPHTFDVCMFDLATRKARVVQSVRLADVSPGLSVSTDGKTVIMAGVAEITQDLIRIENFR